MECSYCDQGNAVDFVAGCGWICQSCLALTAVTPAHIQTQLCEV